jgi:hypothetical protein
LWRAPVGSTDPRFREIFICWVMVLRDKAFS